MIMALPLRKISSLIEFILSIFSIVQYYITFWLKNVFYIANGLIKMYNIDKKEIIRTFKLFYMGGSSMKKIRNILALLMVVVMLVAVMPMNVFATDSPTEPGAGQPAAGAEENHENEQQDPPAAPVTDLDTAKAEAVKTVDTLSDLSQANKDAAKQAINNASTTEDVTKELGKAQALNDAKAQAKDDLKKLTDLTEEQANAAKKEIEDASDIGAVTTAVTKAKGQDEKAKEAKAEEEKEHNITIKESKNGKVEANKKTAKKDVEITLTITPEKDYKLKELKVMAGEKEVEVKDKKFKMPAANVTIKATFDEDKKPDTKPTKYNITVKSIGNGYADADATESEAGKTIIVTAKPYSGYAVARVYLEYNGIRKNINTYYNGYYYDGRYYGRYNDYNKYLDVYENSSYYLRKYDSYREFLRHEYPSHYRYYEDYDYWTDRYDYDWYDRYDNYYYKYFDDFRRSRYDTYEEYLRAEHYTHYRDYYNYRYDYNWYNRYGYTTTDTFEMPASNVTVYVEFTDAYPYYYDDYYYYRTRRDRKAEEAKAKAEAAKKEEEEAKAKAEAEKLPQVYENKAVIAIGSNVLDKVSKNVHTVHQMDTPAYVKDGRVMLPLRYVAEALGLQVSWVPETKTVIIWDLTQRVEIPVKSNRIIVNGITYTSDVKPEIKSSRTMLPIANIARALGLIDGSDIYWDQYNKQVTLTRKVLSK